METGYKLFLLARSIEGVCLELYLKHLLLADCYNNRDSNKVVVKSMRSPGLANFAVSQVTVSCEKETS